MAKVGREISGEGLWRKKQRTRDRERDFTGRAILRCLRLEHLHPVRSPTSPPQIRPATPLPTPSGPRAHPLLYHPAPAPPFVRPRLPLPLLIGNQRGRTAKGEVAANFGGAFFTAVSARGRKSEKRGGKSLRLGFHYPPLAPLNSLTKEQRECM